MALPAVEVHLYATKRNQGYEMGEDWFRVHGAYIDIPTISYIGGAEKFFGSARVGNNSQVGLIIQGSCFNIIGDTNSIISLRNKLIAARFSEGRKYI